MCNQENSLYTSSFKFYIKDDYMICDWVGLSEINTIHIDELFKIKYFYDATDT